LESARMIRMIEQEALGVSDAYPLREMLGELRSSVWRDVDDAGETDALRRSLQRGYLSRMEYLLSAPETQATDIVPLIRGELRYLSDELEEAGSRTRDEVLLLHIRDIQARIGRI